MTNQAESIHNLRNHWWWRPGWHEGRTFYTWHLTFANQPTVHRLTTAYQGALADVPGLDLIPTEWLHITMQGLGFTDEITKADAHTIAEAVRPLLADIPAPTLVFHRPTLRSEAIALTPRPADAIRLIRARIRDAIGHVWNPNNIPETADGYEPHLSLAYVNTPISAATLRKALDTISPEPTNATLTTASLITLERTGHLYHWTPFAVLYLG
ncbi:MAG: 2'-5' RNA ligase family protein [Pseudonocardiaceae bacterium]